jgi:phosphoglycerate kinase
VPTIKELAEAGAKVVVLAHQGDPLDYQNFTSLAEHAERLSKALEKPVQYIDDVCGPAARQAIQALQPGQILMLENVRYHTEETIIFEKHVRMSPTDQAKTPVVAKLAPLADLYVCDAFAAVHRSEPTLVGFQQLIPSAAGRLFQTEVETLTKVREHPDKPCVFALGGAKILDAFSMMGVVLANGAADRILPMGLLMHMFLLADGKQLGEPAMKIVRDLKLDQFVSKAKQILNQFRDKIEMPIDVAIERDGRRVEIGIDQLPADGPILDLGAKTLQRYSEVLRQAKTIFLNGPAGMYEKPGFETGTVGVWRAVAESEGFSVIGGGDTIAVARKFNVADQISYICTAGGGMILFLSGETLPVLEALNG